MKSDDTLENVEVVSVNLASNEVIHLLRLKRSEILQHKVGLENTTGGIANEIKIVDVLSSAPIAEAVNMGRNVSANVHEQPNEGWQRVLDSKLNERVSKLSLQLLKVFE